MIRILYPVRVNSEFIELGVSSVYGLIAELIRENSAWIIYQHLHGGVVSF